MSDHGDMNMPGESMGGMTGMPMGEEPIGIPFSRHGSGTSWLPDSTPMYGVMQQAGEWRLMYHGAAFLAYDKMNGPRGDDKVILTNWEMAMAYRRLNEQSAIRLSTMISIEPLTVGGAGYPLLLQTGETWNDEPLKDHQHPHNYISELSAYYTHSLTRNSAAFAYFGPVGEPAFGPVTYLHRTFGLDDPLAPIGHHWQDATHISFWVATLGYNTQKWKLDASSFNGREPGENRIAFQSPKFDSFSGRISFNPNPNWALEGSYAYLHSPESLHPEEDTHRSDVSVMYNHPLSPRSNFQTTFLWARNRISHQNLDAYLVEAQLKHDQGWTPFLRYEYIKKSAEELVLPSNFPLSQVFNLQQLTLGATRDIFTTGSLSWAIGGEFLLNTIPGNLKSVYGDNPTGWLIYLRIHPKRMAH
ncbi:MAG: hypothetical protein ABFD54_13630 [Armatimonadota bacterium]